MHQTILCSWLLKGTLAVAVVVGGAGSAFAGWGHHGWGGSSGGGWGGSSGGWGSSGGTSGGWGSSGGYWGGSNGGSSGGWGSSGGGRRHGLFGHHRRWGGSSGGGWGGSSGGGWGGSSGGGWGGSSGGYYDGGFSGGSSGGWGSSGGSVYGGGYYSPSVIVPEGEYYGPAKSLPPSSVPADVVPRDAAPPADAPPPAPVPGGSTSINRADGMLIVEVPSDAKIYVNGRLTSTPGEVREYVSRNLSQGYNYAYEVRAEVERDGQIITDTKRVDLRAGESTKLAFNLTPASEVETAITVKVPAGAKVNLGGNDTNLQGETRVFRTSALKPGSEWKNYTIVATLEVDGRQITKEQAIDVKAGESKEVAFDFETTSVAAR